MNPQLMFTNIDILSPNNRVATHIHSHSSEQCCVAQWCKHLLLKQGINVLGFLLMIIEFNEK